MSDVGTSISVRLGDGPPLFPPQGRFAVHGPCVGGGHLRDSSDGHGDGGDICPPKATGTGGWETGPGRGRPALDEELELPSGRSTSARMWRGTSVRPDGVGTAVTAATSPGSASNAMQAARVVNRTCWVTMVDLRDAGYCSALLGALVHRPRPLGRGRVATANQYEPRLQLVQFVSGSFPHSW